MKVLELFAGSRSFSKVAEELGHETFSVDINNFKGIDYVTDILDFDINTIPFKPDVIWASPPCTTFSVASISRHRPFGLPISPEAELGNKYVIKTLEIIKKFDPKFYYIENPRGMLRKQIYMRGLPRTTVWYCKYGENSAKPTDIWSNNITSLFNPEGWNPRPECYNGNLKCHHDKQPRGYTAKKESGALGKGTQGKKDNYERSIVPYELCKEILLSL